MALEIANFIQAIATVYINDGEMYFCGNVGFRAIEKVDVGEYNLIPVELLDNRVPLGVGQPLPVYCNPVFVNTLGLPANGDTRALPIPVNVPEVPGSPPGAIKVFLTDSEGAAQDLGFFTIVVCTLPASIPADGVATV
jgi:hypothetical protein